jgi:mono/diheme cytochrome c family protein
VSLKFWVQSSRLKIWVIGLFIVFNLAACSTNEPSKREFVVADSKSYESSIFRQNCAICHGQEANGKEVNGKLVPSLRYGEAAKKSEAEIYEQIKNGKLPMPAFRNQMPEEDIQKMVKFVIRDLQQRDVESK